MPIDFPSSPSNGDLYSAGGRTWQFDGTSWNLLLGTTVIANGAVTGEKIAADAITAAKIADDAIEAAHVSDNAIQTAHIAAGAVTAAKLGNDISLTPADGSITAAKLATDAVTTGKVQNNAITQGKLASNLSGITVTTTANRSTDIPSPFTGQFCFLTDTSALQRYDGSSWVTAITTVPTGAPTSVTASNVTATSVDLSFSAGPDGGSAITNYQYSLSTDGGVSYPSGYVALSPADATSPITISGLSSGTNYYIKLKAVNALGTGSSESTPVSVDTPPAAPTSLSATPLSSSSISVAFTQSGGATNYQYALSTNGGSTYGSYAALSPADGTSPITISGLSANTAYDIKLKAVSAAGTSSESSATSTTTLIAAPTGLSTSSATTSSIVVSFTQPTGGGGNSVTNYKYALSTDGGSTYGAYTALSPTDASSPITISGLTNGTTYSAKIRAVTAAGDGDESSATSFTLPASVTVDYLVVGGGGGGSGLGGGGGGAGVLSSVAQGGGANGVTGSALSLQTATSYSVSIGAGGPSVQYGTTPANMPPLIGSGSTFDTVTARPGGPAPGSTEWSATGSYACGGGGNGGYRSAGSSADSNYGYGGSTGGGSNATYWGGGGGGAGQAGNSGSSGVGGNGGTGRTNSITGSTVYYAGGGGGCGGSSAGSGAAGGGGNGVGGGGQGGWWANYGYGGAGGANTGGGGGGGGTNGNGNSSGGSGVVILRYPSSRTITLSAGLTGSTTTVSSNKVTTITGGSGTVSWA